MRGLTLLAKNDVHFQVGLNAFEEFSRSLQEQLRSTGKSSFKPVAVDALQTVVRSSVKLESDI